MGATSQLFLWILFKLASVAAINEVTSLRFETSSHDDAGTSGTITITLWFNFTVYQYQKSGVSHDTAYTKTSPDILGLADCPKPQYNNIPETKMMIQNSASNGIYIDNIRFDTISGDWFGITSFCIPSSSVPKGWPNSWKISDSICASGYHHYSDLCIDTESDDCYPSKQVLQFDTSSPNQYITNAIWSSGINVDTVIRTCEPTKRPTINPTMKPTAEPTINPTNDPTDTPTAPPTQYPTMKPTVAPTVYPTLNPTHHPTVISTLQQTLHPISKPTLYPTLNPTLNPTNGVTNTPINTADLIRKTTSDAAVGPIRLGFKTKSIWPVVILVLIILLSCCCALYFCCIRRTKYEGNNKNAAEMTTFGSMNMDMEKAKVKHWLKDIVGLPQYYALFIETGYESIEFIMDMEDRSELKKIGIDMLGHQTAIWAQIKKLKQEKREYDVVGNRKSKWGKQEKQVHDLSEPLLEREGEGAGNSKMFEGALLDFGAATGLLMNDIVDDMQHTVVTDGGDMDESQDNVTFQTRGMIS